MDTYSNYYGTLTTDESGNMIYTGWVTYDDFYQNLSNSIIKEDLEIKKKIDDGTYHFS